MRATSSAEELTAALPKALAAGTVIPIFCTSAKKDIGIAELLDSLAAYALSPVQGRKRAGTKGQGDKAAQVAVEPNESFEFIGQVFKTLSDRFVGNLSYFRVYSGKLTAEQPLVNVRTGQIGALGRLAADAGQATRECARSNSGRYCRGGQGRGPPPGRHHRQPCERTKLPRPAFPTPMFGLAVEPKSRGDEQKISTSLTKIADEDPTFHITRDNQTKELVITGMSQLHLDVIQHRLKRRFDLEVTTKEPKIPYRETITTNAEAMHRHKKQTGGRGQFGEVHLRVYPLPRRDHRRGTACWSNLPTSRVSRSCVRPTTMPSTISPFIDSIVGGTIPNQFVPAVEKGCKELLDRGALAGYRMQDVAVEVYFGKDHPVDSSEAAFKTAGRIAFKNAFLAARPVLLEPIVDLEVTLPSKYTGAILGDLNTKRARIENQDSLPGDLAVIKAKVPLAEVTRYAAQLGSITQGQGSYSMEFSHYDQVPGNVQQQIVSKAKVAAEEED